MRYQPQVSIQNLKQERTKKQRNRYSEALSLINNKGTFHLLQNGDILTCYEQLDHGRRRINGLGLGLFVVALESAEQ
jgi:hypothetical protein